MNRQRKVVITVTYNDLGVIVDVKAEELDSSAQPNVQDSVKDADCISRQSAIDAKQEFRNPNVVRSTEARTAYDRTYANGWNDCNSAWIDVINALPSAQPEQAMKDCRNCKHGKYNDHLETHFCYNPNECTEWKLWEPIAQPERKPYHEEWISALRTAEPERKMGEWLFEEYPDGYYHSECSVCKHWFVEDAFLKPYNFCPNCGARMETPDER